jgi:hypothetical protein
VDAVLPACIAVAGTLLGSIVTYLFSRRGAERTAALAYSDRLRQERLDSYSAFAGALIKYRLAELDRWHRERDDPDGELHQLAKATTYERRADAFDALFRVQLLTEHEVLLDAARDAVDVIGGIHKAGTAEERDQQAKDARAAIDSVVGIARTHLRPARPIAANLADLGVDRRPRRTPSG